MVEIELDAEPLPATWKLFAASTPVAEATVELRGGDRRAPSGGFLRRLIPAPLKASAALYPAPAEIALPILLRAWSNTQPAVAVAAQSDSSTAARLI